LLVAFGGVSNSLLPEGFYREADREPDSIDEKELDSFSIMDREDVFRIGDARSVIEIFWGSGYFILQ